MLLRAGGSLREPGPVQAFSNGRETGSWAFPKQFVHGGEKGEIGSERRQVSKEESQIALVAEHLSKPVRIRNADVRVSSSGRNGFELAEP